MKYLLFCFILGLAACSSSKLKRCDGKASEVDLWVCPTNVQGQYYKCDKPADLYHCSDPQ